uniref:NADH dehydrogenase subunit 1 n=1 Tax=Kuphus polythalamius TaxID=1049060 RepID=UPI0020289420|nr:NADH dehydrogenase subunit 1 [Kuphus polythalamius]UPX89193.1 NADH dehydrogenase subunit 1 [Kuphus polythalamius]UPX89205.1 NADH dehydrogenase subunit 1 [Kuphus polythalamius]
MLSAALVVLVMQLGVSYFIVTERKGLGMIQLRQGPNKAAFKGLGQPIADGVKLFLKQLNYPVASSMRSYLLGPGMLFFFSCLAWMIFPFTQAGYRYEWGLLYFLCVSSVHVFGVFVSGYACSSRYGLLGAMRGVAQSVSYEIIMSAILFCPLLFVGSYDLVSCRSWGLLNGLMCFEGLLIWMVVMLAETNRTPFDFVEGESELVAGYSVEYGGGAFALIALAEYGNILFASVVTVALFFSGVGLWCVLPYWYDLWLGLCSAFVCYVFIAIRGAVPRFRYDLLMRFCWVTLLPLTLGVMGLCVFAF